MADAGTLPGDGPLLVLCDVSRTLSVTLGRPGSAPPSHRRHTATGQSAEILTPLIAEVLAGAGLCPSDLGGIACVRGPGGFTGIRVVLATALGLSFGAGIPMAGLDFLPLLAATAARQATGAVVVITHARTEQVYLQPFLADGDALALGPPEALPLREAAGRVAEAAAVGPLALIGDGVVRYRKTLAAAAPLAVFINTPGPDPQVLLSAAARAAYGFAPVTPLYLRPSDAEENLVELTARRGLSPEVARERLRRAVADD